ncbi:hypothetical protein Nther_0691 [Natranaerobius thermophilus JW/NM-WN-LF]|uniref:Uncharacterized protein n=1 Tax=Natranaerobius thermophilus (strain ATCC BAA-1301 / DSM 18059 / JW/NM-WN-LF) TaxID=457570 RepID=B2A789_NATTJ|nr:hypothetical protein Nther_0691 [Natranaerobius thermophilus JW/NM-WN-LF]
MSLSKTDEYTYISFNEIGKMELVLRSFEQGGA